ncbi:MAG: hypothetical protein MJ210_05885, partial [Alphaproteobacteria bacterium]|nr:hypothetical protein [Alphaproteobacteria bacterium]
VEVGGSNPLIPTNKKATLYGCFFCWFWNQDLKLRRRRFDKEKQRIRKYARSCGDAATQAPAQSNPLIPTQKNKSPETAAYLLYRRH